MKVKQAATERFPRNRRFRAYAPAALALGVVFVAAFTAVLFTGAVSRADGPPDLGTAFHLPFKLEQGRPAPARSSSGPRQAVTTPTPSTPLTPTPPTPDGTPTATEIPTLDPPTLESNHPPAAPTNLNAYAIAFSIIEVEWDQPDGDVDGFELQISEDGGNSWRLLAGKSRLSDPAGRLYTWYQQYGLSGNQTRHYRVRAGSGDNWSDWSASDSATTHTTSSPDLSIEALGETSLNVSWDRPFAYATITGWELQVTEDAPAKETISITIPIGSQGGYWVRSPRTPSGQNWTTLATLEAADRTYTHTGLEPGDTRYYRVRATTDVGTASWSRGNIHAITHRGDIPPAPRLNGRANGASEIVLTWNRVDSPTFPVSMYELQDSHDGQHWYDFDLTWGDNSRVNIYIEEPGTTRHYRIRAESDGVLGPWSRATSVTTENGGAGEPTGLKAVEAGTTWVELTWQAPKKKGSGITGYQVQQTVENDIHDWVNVGSINAKTCTSDSTCTFRVTGLKPSSYHQYRVAARDGGGLGPWGSDHIHAKTKGVSLAAPTLTVEAGYVDYGPDYPVDLRRYAVWAELNWNASREYDYILEWSPNGRDNWQGTSPYTHMGPGFLEKHDLDFGETRFYRIRAYKDRDEPGDWSNVVKVTMRMVPPSHLPDMTVESKSTNHIELSWQPPESDGGRPVTGYEIQTEEGEQYTWDGDWPTLATLGANARTYTHSGLEPDNEHCYRIRAKNSVGWGNWTIGREMCFRTKKLSPGAPTTITVQEKDDATGIELSWDEPDTRGLTLSAYHVGISSNAEHWYVFRDGVPATQQTATYSYQFIRKYPHFAGAGSDIRAYFRVRAKATNGELGDWSEASDILIPPG